VSNNPVECVWQFTARVSGVHSPVLIARCKLAQWHALLNQISIFGSYEALRKGPKWNSTLFIITYDEHGGFFDHVPPPQVCTAFKDCSCGVVNAPINVCRGHELLTRVWSYAYLFAVA
jgi:hypothetical protein